MKSSKLFWQSLDDLIQHTTKAQSFFYKTLKLHYLFIKNASANFAYYYWRMAMISSKRFTQKCFYQEFEISHSPQLNLCFINNMHYTIDNITALIGARRFGNAEASIEWLLTDSRSLAFPEV